MSDKLLMENYLLILKSSLEVYNHGTIESSNSDIRKILKDTLNDTLESQEDTYNLMCENNWYVIDNIKCEDIKKVYEKVKCE